MLEIVSDKSVRPVNLFRGGSVSNLVGQVLATAFKEGHVKPSRNGDSKALRNAIMVLDRPRNRHLNLEGRKSNIFQMIAETIWVMAGERKVTGFLEFFLPRAPQYSDDGTNWHGAYGPRIYAYGQLENVVAELQANPDTRRAVIMIADITRDSKGAIEAQYGEGHSPKDIPCNREIHFNIYNGLLSMKVIQRSGDLLFGAGSINPFEFTFLHELVVEMLQARGVAVELGEYIWDVTDAHYYTAFEEQVDAVAKQGYGDRFLELPKFSLTEPALGTKFNTADEVRDFFSSLLYILDNLRNTLINYVDRANQGGTPLDRAGTLYAMKSAEDSIQRTLEGANVDPKGQLANYLRALLPYIYTKATGVTADVTLFYHMRRDSDFAFSLRESPFRKFPIAFVEQE